MVRNFLNFSFAEPSNRRFDYLTGPLPSVSAYTLHPGVLRSIFSSKPVDPRVVEAMQPYFFEHFGNPSSLHLEDDRIQDIKFQTFGCGSAVATSSMVTELGKGVYNSADDISLFKDKRVLVRDMGDAASAELAIALNEHTGRVIFITRSKEKDMNPDVKKQLKRSDVKALFETELLKIMGHDEVEKVLVNDLDEEQEYELFVDVVVIRR